MTSSKNFTPPFSKFKYKSFIQYAKVSKFIYQLGETDLLRQVSKEINIYLIKNNSIQTKLNFVKKRLLKYRQITGVGRAISAIQVGTPLRFAVIYTPEKIITIINPKITKKSDKKYLYPEMCMSAVPIIAPVSRPAWIEFEYLDEFGNLQKWNKKDKMLNRVFQHEIDHMNGIINIDLVKNPKDLTLYSNPTFYNNAKFTKVK